MIPSEWLEQARQRVAPYITPTPLTYDADRHLFIKWENRQRTGSFKLRGALNKILSLEPWERERGLVTASTGNHGRGVAIAAQLCQAHATVFTTESAPRVKREAMRQAGAQVRLVPGSFEEAENTAIAYAAQIGATWISAYNDGQVIAGQGTISLEILEELAALEQSTWLVPVSGGGLISGIGACLKARDVPSWASALRKAGKNRLVGVQAAAAPFMHHILRHGTNTQVDERPTLADGVSGDIERNSLTIPMVRQLVDDILLVEEDEIAAAIAFAWEKYGEKVEGAGATGLAAALFGRIPEKPCVVVISGGNIDPEVHQRVVREKREFHSR